MIYFFRKIKCDIFNYADDNTISKSSKNSSHLITTLVNDTSSSIDWFVRNGLLANKDKFQAMAIGNLASDIRSLNIHDTDIEMVDHIKTLGINIDNRPNFKAHVSEICVKAGRQINILRRLSKIP